jgi:tRNA nucleotidyltransferase/poly(A) polymerase
MKRQLIDSIWLHWPETKALAKAVGPLRFVGGCVRDALLGREVKDVDAATPLPPAQVMKRLKAAGLKAIPTGIDHGTVTARIGERHFEVTTLRRDVTTDGRHATVAFTENWQEDAARRDFTMNALYCDAQGLVYDYFGGMEDAQAGKVRFIGDAAQRIREDSLRILRFFRFFAHYGQGAVDVAAIKACGELSSLIDTLSGERICLEMLKLLTSERAGEVVGIMQRQGVWPFVVPANVKTETLALLPPLLRKAGSAPDALLSLALLLRSTQKAQALADGVALRWKLSKAQHKRLAALCELQVAGCRLQEKDWKKRIRAWGPELFIDRMILSMAEGAEEATALAAIALARSWEIPVFPVTGDDLIARGVKPGKELGEKLGALEARWEESGYVMSTEELLKPA